jgi:hypothetical protein
MDARIIVSFVCPVALVVEVRCYETKSSDEGQILRPLWSKSVVRDKVLR